MKTKILKISSVFVAVIIVFSCFTFSASAEPSYVFNFPIAKPDVDEHSALIEVLYTTDNGATVNAEILYVTCPYDMVHNPDETGDTVLSHFYIEVWYGDLVISQGYRDDDWIIPMSYYYCRPDGSIAFFTSGLTDQFVVGYSRILGIHVYGSAFVKADANSHDPNFVTANFVFNYGSDALANTKLDVIIGLLRDSNSAGSGTAHPDFGSTNSALDSTTAEMQAVENGYKIDEAATTQELNKGSAFISSTDMQRASVQVKSWIEEFASENKVFSSFLVAALCLGLCFWVIGRKTSK